MSENMNQMQWNTVEEAYSYAKEQLLKKTRESIELASKALEFCAGKGNSAAQYQLYALKYNLGDTKEEYRAIAWCKKAAEQDYALAQYDLALHYLYGDAVKQNMYSAITWMERAAAHGYPEAIDKLIILYNAGTKVRQNLPRAEYWKMVRENPAYLQEQTIPSMNISYLALQEEDIRFRTDEAVAELQKKIFESWNVVTQEAVISAGSDKSFVIHAGPGTGKTHLLLQRIVNIVAEQGVNAERVMVVSSSLSEANRVKKSVTSLAERIGCYDLYNTYATTIHVMARNFKELADEKAKLGSIVWSDWKKEYVPFDKVSYDDYMIRAAELLQKHSELVRDWQYLIIDDVQNLTHGKAVFVLALIKACLKYNIPFLLMGDSCQSIYDYQSDLKNTSGVHMPVELFYEELREIGQGLVTYACLNETHRSVTALQKQTEPIRQLILEREQGKFGMGVREFREDVEAVAFSEIKEFMQRNEDKTVCLLARSNVAARHLSSELLKRKIGHTYLSNQDRYAYPRRIAEVFGGCQGEAISSDEFMESCTKTGIETSDAKVIWNLLLANRTTKNETPKLSELLELLQTHQYDYLFDDATERKRLTVSNIHQARGMEFDYVCIDDDFLRFFEKEEEEMKTFYVAVTRAKEKNYALIDTRALRGIQRDIFKRGRKFQLQQKVKTLTHIEVFSNGDRVDVHPEDFLVSNMANAQSMIASLKLNDPLLLVYDKGKKRYAIKVKNTIIGWMSEAFTSAVQYQNDNKLPIYLDDVYVDGVFTYISGSEPDEGNTDEGYRVWNYVTFSGMAHANYGDPNKKLVSTVNKQNVGYGRGKGKKYR